MEAEKSVVAEYVEAFGRGDSEKLRRLFTSDALVQGVLGSATLDTALGIWRDLHEAFGIELEIQEMIAENDRVAVRYTERGRFRGEFRGHAPSGKTYEVIAMEWFEMKEGKIHRRWGARDFAAIARQIDLPFA